MWINPTTSVRYSNHSAIRHAFPQVSLPAVLLDALIAELGLVPMTLVAKPAFNPLTHDVVELAPVLVNDHYEQQWSIVAVSVEEATTRLTKARKERWREVKALRDDKIKNGGIFTNAQWYPSTAEAKAAILWVLKVGSNTGERIELLDGSMANLTFNRCTDLLAAGATQSAAIHTQADALKTAIDASTDPSTVDITAGWPAVYVA